MTEPNEESSHKGIRIYRPPIKFDWKEFDVHNYVNKGLLKPGQDRYESKYIYLNSRFTFTPKL